MSDKKRRSGLPSAVFFLALSAICLTLCACSSQEPAKLPSEPAADKEPAADEGPAPDTTIPPKENPFDKIVYYEPRMSQLEHTEKNYAQYDSYVIGCAGSEAYSAESLNEYFGGKFYNFNGYCGNLQDYVDLTAYILQNYTVKNILFDMSGLLRPGEDERYYAQCADAAQSVKELCSEKNVRFEAVLSPVYADCFKENSESDLTAFYTQLAEKISFWDFSLTSLSYSDRYFLDGLRLRCEAADMVLAKMFSNENVWYPEAFGAYVTAESVGSRLQDILADNAFYDEAAYVCRVPIIMYHHIAETVNCENADNAVTAEVFRSHMETLKNSGYNTVTAAELMDFVQNGGALPENPICITFDDGYLSNYEIAFPILRELQMKATVFAIGVSVGSTDFYKDTSFPITPHFSYEQAKEMLESGVIDIQSHTYDMHQWEPYETGDSIRCNILKLANESESEYANTLKEDTERYQKEMLEKTGHTMKAMAYPGGAYDALSEKILLECGFSATFSSDNDCINEIIRGMGGSLFALGRRNITGYTSNEALLKIVRGENKAKTLTD